MNNVKAYKTEAGRVTVVGNGYAIQYQYIDENALTEPAPAPEPAPEPEPPPPPPEPEAEAPVKEAPSETFLHAFALPFSIVSTNPKGEDIDKDQITIGICRAMILYLKGMIKVEGPKPEALTDQVKERELEKYSETRKNDRTRSSRADKALQKMGVA